MQVHASNYSEMRSRWVAVVFMVAIFLFAAKGNAQLAGTGSIQGSISDATGAIIQNANVTVTNIATQVKHNVVTGGNGLYSFPNLDIGTYTLDVVSQGFEHYSQSNIVLEVGSSIAINVAMTVGRTDQKIEVQSSGLALQTEDASFKQTIDQQTVTEMPLNGRNMTSLITLSGGSTSAPAGDFTGTKYSYAAISVSIAGGGGNTTMWRLDGGDNNDYMANANLPFPFPDAVNQFSVESTVLGASNGQHTGGLVNVVTRSGTNTYHGSAFEFIRNNYIDATNFFSTKKDQLHQNQYGGTFGGKILRDRLFAFAAYQHLHAAELQAKTQAHVPTAANLLGDFSVTDGPNCSATASQLVDPLTGVKLVGNKYPSKPTYNPQSLALMKYLPVPDPAVDTLGCGLVSYAIPSLTTDNQFVTRVDWTVNARNNLFGRYFLDGYQFPAYFDPHNILITTQSGNIERVQSFTLGEAFTISPRTVNDAHVTILRRSNNRGYAPNDINAATLGVDVYQAVPNGLQLATGKFTIGGGTNSVAHFNDNTLAVDDDVTMIRGKHQVLFGGEWVQNQLNIGNAYESNGIFTFASSFSAYGPSGSRPSGAPSQPGDQSLDFLMGTMSAFQQSKQQQNALRGPVPSLYVQDTFHATKQLTVTGGLRWSPNFMPTDYFNRGVVFNMSNFLSNTVSKVYPNAPAGAMYYGDPGVTKQFTKNSPWQFAPNLGLSYDPFGTGKTVVRAGGSLGYDQVNFFTGQRNQQNPPYATAISQQQVSATAPISFSSPWSVGAITTSPFPQPQIPPSTAQFFPQSQYIVLPAQYHPSYTIQYTASVQQEFSRGWQFQLQYIGNRTEHSPMGLGLSPAVFIPGVWGANGTGCAGIVTTGPAAVKPGAAGTACSTTANQTSRFRLTIANPKQGNSYVGGGGGTVLSGDSGIANYNGMVATIQHRLSSTFSFLANYTWSKCLNIEDAQGDLAGTTVENIDNPRMDYAPCGSDYRHVENVVIVAKSQFGLPRVEALLLNNWEFAPLVHITSGAPFTVTAGQDNSLTDTGNDRPNLTAGAPVYTHTVIRSGSGASNRGYLVPSSFSQIPTSAFGTYGNLGRNAFRGMPAYQFDAQISRIFQLYERLNMTLRLEAFNLLNHPNFSNPSAGLTSSTFGQISGTSNAARVFQGSVKFIF